MLTAPWKHRAVENRLNVPWKGLPLISLILLTSLSWASCVITKVITDPLDAGSDGGQDVSQIRDAHLDAHRDAAADARNNDAAPSDSTVTDATLRDAVASDAVMDADLDATVCPTGWKMCDGECRNLATDPHHCGDCNIDCGPGGYCNGTCHCLPGLMSCNGSCVDISSDPDNCGDCGLACPGTLPRCAHFNCTFQECSQMPGYESCGDDEDSCVRTDDMVRDPLHCSGCDQTCGSGQFCIQSECVDFTPAPNCASCPCQDCGTDRCCILGGLGLVVCVAGDHCP